MKRIIPLLTCLLLAACVERQVEKYYGPLPIPSRDEIALCPDYLSGCLRVYPDTDYVSTPPPHGFKAFYISHLGRHGARYQVPQDLYTKTLKTFVSADSLGILTDKGQQVYADVRILCEEAVGRAGELTGLGEQEHRHIAERMYLHYPQVFRGKARLDVQTTDIVRSILSGVFATERLKELNPSILITRSSHPGNWDELFGLDNVREIATLMPELRADTSRARVFNGDRLCAELFADPHYPGDDERWRLASRIFSLASDAKGAGHPEIDLFSCFTPDERFRMWERHNASVFYRHMPSSRFGHKGTKDAVSLWRRIENEADAAIEGRGVSANLRFAHDQNVCVFVALTGLGYSGGVEKNYEDISSFFCDFLYIPFACNIQMVYFRNSAGEVLVKFLLNERETLLAGLETDTPPFYVWNDVKKYVNESIEYEDREIYH